MQKSSQLLRIQLRASEILFVRMLFQMIVGDEAQAERFHIIQRRDAGFRKHAHADHRSSRISDELLVVSAPFKKRAADHRVTAGMRFDILSGFMGEFLQALIQHILRRAKLAAPKRHRRSKYGYKSVNHHQIPDADIFSQTSHRARDYKIANAQLKERLNLQSDHFGKRLAGWRFVKMYAPPKGQNIFSRDSPVDQASRVAFKRSERLKSGNLIQGNRPGLFKFQSIAPAGSEHQPGRYRSAFRQFKLFSDKFRRQSRFGFSFLIPHTESLSLFLCFQYNKAPSLHKSIKKREIIAL
jgi:hypothetical protein